MKKYKIDIQTQYYLTVLETARLLRIVKALFIRLSLNANDEQ